MIAIICDPFLFIDIQTTVSFESSNISPSENQKLMILKCIPLRNLGGLLRKCYRKRQFFPIVSTLIIGRFCFDRKYKNKRKDKSCEEERVSRT